MVESMNSYQSLSRPSLTLHTHTHTQKGTCYKLNLAQTTCTRYHTEECRKNRLKSDLACSRMKQDKVQL